MIRNLLLAALLATFAGGSVLHAEPPLAEVGIFKSSIYRQKSATSIVGEAGRPYLFEARAKILKSELGKALVVVIPNGGKVPATTLLEFGEFQTLAFPAQYRTLGVLNQSYPFGTYSARLEFFTRSSVTMTFPLKAQDFPATPKFTNWSAAQSIDPSRPFVLQWSRFADADPDDLIMLKITETCGCTTPIDRTFFTNPISRGATSITLPAGLLNPADSYTVELTFVHTDLRVVADNAISKGSGVATTLVTTIKTQGR